MCAKGRHMLRRIKVDGYKGLRGTSLELKQDGLTVLLGPNGSGKSSIFGAIRLLREATESGGLGGDAPSMAGAARDLDLRRLEEVCPVSFGRLVADLRNAVEGKP
jgi:ABC-type lipoprotein export system ATPase subunit